MREQIAVVSAQPEDASGIRTVQRTTWLETYPNNSLKITSTDLEEALGSDDAAWVENARKQIAENPSFHTLVAKDERDVVGYCVVENSTHKRIHGLYVLPKYHGKGIGKELTNQGLHWLGKTNKIYVNVASYNTHALEFYEKLGFKKTEKDLGASFTFSSGASIPEVELVKEAE